MEGPQNITIDDVNALVSNRWGNRDAISLLKTLQAFYYSDKPEEKGWVEDYLNLLNKMMAYAITLGQNLGVPYVNVKSIRRYLLDQTDFKSKPEEFFPFPLYIAATKNADGDWADIGIMVDQSGKVLEIHEGNDEASPETIALANKLVNPSGKKVRVYGHHGTALCRKIEDTGYLPPNLYVSPRKDFSPNWGHAGADTQDDRSMFTGIIDLNDVNQEDEVAWKTVGNTKIDKFRWL